jgi:hypothetical protein
MPSHRFSLDEFEHAVEAVQESETITAIAVTPGGAVLVVTEPKQRRAPGGKETRA